MALSVSRTIITIIVVTIRHQSGLNRLVSASTNSLFEGFRSHLRPFCLQFSIILGVLLLFILVSCRNQFYFHLFSFSSTSFISDASKISSILLWSKSVHRLFFCKPSYWLKSLIFNPPFYGSKFHLHIQECILEHFWTEAGLIALFRIPSIWTNFDTFRWIYFFIFTGNFTTETFTNPLLTYLLHGAESLLRS